MFVKSRIKPIEIVYLDRTYKDPNGTVHEQDFFDRTEIKQSVKICLANEGTSLLVGARRSGKSSFIRHMAHQLCDEPDSSYVHAKILQGETIWITTSVRFAKMIIIAVSHAFKQPMPPEIESLPTLSNEDFLQELKQITNKYPNKNVLLTIDEIDALFDSIETVQDKIVTAGLIQALVEAASVVDNPLPFRFLFTTVAVPSYLNLPPNFFREFYLEPFSESDFDELIAWLGGSKVTELSIDDRIRCHELTGRWPFYLHWLFQEASFRKIDMSNGWPDRTIQEVTMDPGFPTSYLGNTITKTYNDLDNIHAKALLLLLTKQPALTKDDLLKMGTEYLEAAEQLSSYGYFSGSEELGYSYRLEIFRTYLQKLEGFQYEYKFLRSQLHLNLPKL